jgi:hypothetical protein
MTIQKLQTLLENVLKDGILNPESPVKFRSEKYVKIADVDYALTEQVQGTLLLCYDDGVM